MYDYKSPIEIIYGQMQAKMEGDIYKAVQSYDIKVDKEELLKALEYDRAQYDKGYKVGYDVGFDFGCEIAHPKWISIKDRLPDVPGKYLVTGRTCMDRIWEIWICEGLCLGGFFGWCNNAKNPIVEYWMPLPEPPDMRGAEDE